MRVAVVDDDPTLVKALGLLFGDEPALRFVGGAFTVADGINLVARRQPDVLLVDVRMPAGGGVAVAAKAHELAPRTVILAMSATDDPDPRLEMAEAGAAGYMVKNVDMAELLNTIDKAGHTCCDPTSQMPCCPPHRPDTRVGVPVAAGEGDLRRSAAVTGLVVEVRLIAPGRG